MGCTLTKTEDENNSVQAPVQTEELCVFTPGLRLPKDLELKNAQLEGSASNLLGRLTELHTRVAEAARELVHPKKLKKRRSSLSASCITQLRDAIEDYLPVLLKLVRREPRLADKILFTWTNQEDEIKETTVQSPYYEMLSVLQLLATLSLLEANKALLFKPASVSVEDSQHKQIMDENKKSAMDVLFKAAEILECALKSVLPEAPRGLRNELPVDLKEEMLQAMQLQALGQTVEIQLGLAIDNPKATMAVKRRLACEELKYWQQAYESLQAVHLGNGWSDKHLLFIRWKRAEAKAAAYYFHSLIVHESSDRRGAAACLRASAHFFKESERICGDFCATAPMTNRTLVGKSPSWGPMKHLAEKIPKESLATSQHDCSSDKALEKLALPDFALAFQVDEYQMPQADEGLSEEEVEADDQNVVDFAIQGGGRASF